MRLSYFIKTATAVHFFIGLCPVVLSQFAFSDTVKPSSAHVYKQNRHTYIYNPFFNSKNNHHYNNYNSNKQKQSIIRKTFVPNNNKYDHFNTWISRPSAINNHNHKNKFHYGKVAPHLNSNHNGYKTNNNLERSRLLSVMHKNNVNNLAYRSFSNPLKFKRAGNQDVPLSNISNNTSTNASNDNVNDKLTTPVTKTEKPSNTPEVINNTRTLTPTSNSTPLNSNSTPSNSNAIISNSNSTPSNSNPTISTSKSSTLISTASTSTSTTPSTTMTPSSTKATPATTPKTTTATHSTTTTTRKSTTESENLNVSPIPPNTPDSYPFYVSSSIKSLHHRLYQQVFNKIMREGLFFNNQTNRATPPFEFKSPAELKSLLDFTLSQKRTDHKTLVNYISSIFKYNPKASHPFKVDRHSNGFDPYALIADFIGTLTENPLGGSLGSVFKLMEQEVYRIVRELINYPEGKGDGMIADGTGMGNAYAMNLALQAKFPGLKKKGLIGIGSPQAVLFLSEQAAASHEKYCMLIGIGVKGCIRVKVDEKGRMDVRDLDKKIEKSVRDGATPFMIIATAGTPILGAIDNIAEIVKVGEKYGNLWIHVDGYLAGSNFLTKNQKHRLNGIEKSDSFLWSVDKTLAAPSATAVLVTRQENILKKTLGISQVHPTSQKGSLYNGTAFDTGRSNPEVAKIWFMWKAKGQQRLAKHVEYGYNTTRMAVNELKARNSSFRLVLEDFESSQIAFYYIPTHIQKLPTSTQEIAIKLSRYTENLRALLIRAGIMSVSVNRLPNFPLSFLVMTFGNSALTKSDVLYLFDQIQVHGEGESLKNRLTKIIGKNVMKQSDSRRNADVSSINNDDEPTPPQVPLPSFSYPDFVSSPIESLHWDFFVSFFKMVLETGTYYEDKTEPAFLFKSPKKIREIMDFSLRKPIEGVGMMNDASDEKSLLDIVKNIITYTGHTGHPYFSFHGRDPYSVMADYIISTVNSPMITYEDSPVWSVMEDVVGKFVRQRIGYFKIGSKKSTSYGYRNNGDDDDDNDLGDGVIVPGGVAAIQTAMVAAYFSRTPKAKEFGNIVDGRQLVAFMSSDAQTDMKTACIFKGMGEENCIVVPTDQRGRMNVTALRITVEKTLKERKIPFFVSASIGTSTLGAIDSVDEIADICEEFGLWLHVDGDVGAAILFLNETTRLQKVQGLARSNSFHFNPKKVFGTIREGSVLVTKHGNALKQATYTGRPSHYIEFNNQELYDGSQLDSGIKQWYQERRGSIFSTWFMMKAKGFEGLGEHVEHAFNLTEQVTAELRRRNESFTMALPHFESLNVNFYYVPKSLRHLKRNSTEFLSAKTDVQYAVHRSLILNNKIVLDEPSSGYFILPLYNSAITLEDVKYLFDLIEFYGKDV